MFRRSMLAAAIGVTIVGAHARAETPGVTSAEVKVGATFPFSGPASPLSNTGKGLIAYINSINDRGGINGRKINLITYDDAYSPPKTVEQTRKLVESDEVAFLFGPLGTPGIGATIKYVNAKKVPHLFVVSGVTKFTNFSEFPMTTTGLPSYDTEGRIYAKYVTQARPDAKIAILYQNDDLGKEFLNAFKRYLKDDFDKKVVSSSYEVTEPTIDSHVVKLKSSGAEAFLVAGTPKFAAQAIKKADEVGWKPLFLINFVSSSVSSTIVPAGPEKAVGIVAATITKDPNDKKWADDPASNGTVSISRNTCRERTSVMPIICSVRSRDRSWSRCSSSAVTISRARTSSSNRGAYAACRSPLSYRVLRSTRARKAVWRTRSCSCSAGTAARGINSARFSAPRKSERVSLPFE